MDSREGNFQNIHKTSFDRFSPTYVTNYLIVAFLYISWLALVLGFRSDHFLLIVGASFLYFATDYTRKLVLSFLIFLLYWLIFDSIRLFPAYNFMDLHIEEPYLLEKAWFGIQSAQGILTPNEYWAQHRYIWLDLYTAAIYLAWIPVPITFALYNFIKGDRRTTIHYFFAFFLVTQLGLIFQYLYPAAPPWYVDLYGFKEILDTPGNPGALINVDEYLGISLFKGMYGMNANVFAAIPSLHCAFPIILLYFARSRKLTGWTIAAVIMMVSTWFSAVYTNHHYIIDVIAGILTGTLAVALYHYVIMKTRVRSWLDNWAKKVS